MIDSMSTVSATDTPIIYVNGTGGNDDLDGNSWEQPRDP